MGENPAAGTKACAQCGADVTSAPRVKDSKGNYYCAACAEKKKAAMAKKVAEGGGAAKPASAAAASVPELDIMSRLIDDSVAKSAVSCPGCRKPWREGAVVCTNCGYNKQTNQMAGTQIKEPALIKEAKAPKVKSKGSGGKKHAGAHWKVCLVLLALFGGGFALAVTDKDLAIVFVLGVYLYSAAFTIFCAVDAYMESESILKGLLVFFCGIYALWYGCFETENDLLKGSAWAFAIIWLLYLMAVFVFAVAVAGAQAAGGGIGPGGP